MFAQRLPYLLQRRHWKLIVMGVVPDHVPVVVESV
jgi:hypothetical protein